MSQPPAKKLKSPAGPRSWHPEARDDAKREAGSQLLSHLLKLYATCRLTATDFCKLCSLCNESGCIGAAFGDYAYDGKNAQRHLDSIIPRGGEMLEVPAPMNLKKDSLRSVHNIPTRVLWASLDKEVKDNPEIKSMVNSPADSRPASCMGTAAYCSHPRVIQAMKEKKELPIPLAIYVDGVSFVAAASGRCESCIGFWAENVLTGTRHFLTSVKSQDLCSCGCRGWCSLRPILSTISWQLENIQDSRVPTHWPDGRPYQPEARGCSKIFQTLKRIRCAFSCSSQLPHRS
jgi:hypothetical protein